MFKKLVILILTLLIFISVNAEINKVQNKKNIQYMNELDNNLVDTIKILDAFNKSTDNISYDIIGIERYQKFLMEMAMICMNLRNDITDSTQLNSEQRESFVHDIINLLKPDVETVPAIITEKQNEQGIEYCRLFTKRINSYLIKLLKDIVKEEEAIMETRTFTQHYFHLHSQQFMYQLVISFLKPSDYLSKENRAFLIRVISEIEYNISNSPDPVKK
ncbi:MAG: hypothetical protein P9L97_08470 [Candidatus Tenebribacter davisii]|jgi:hypothetical protein|nr:hypothetical protein [Candidatus Tenebribacter davisii]